MLKLLLLCLKESDFKCFIWLIRNFKVYSRDNIFYLKKGSIVYGVTHIGDYYIYMQNERCFLAYDFSIKHIKDMLENKWLNSDEIKSSIDNIDNRVPPNISMAIDVILERNKTKQKHIISDVFHLNNMETVIKDLGLFKIGRLWYSHEKIDNANYLFKSILDNYVYVEQRINLFQKILYKTNHKDFDSSVFQYLETQLKNHFIMKSFSK